MERPAKQVGVGRPAERFGACSRRTGKDPLPEYQEMGERRGKPGNTVTDRRNQLDWRLISTLVLRRLHQPTTHCVPRARKKGCTVEGLEPCSLAEEETRTIEIRMCPVRTAPLVSNHARWNFLQGRRFISWWLSRSISVTFYSLRRPSISNSMPPLEEFTFPSSRRFSLCCAF